MIFTFFEIVEVDMAPTEVVELVTVQEYLSPCLIMILQLCLQTQRLVKRSCRSEKDN